LQQLTVSSQGTQTRTVRVALQVTWRVSHTVHLRTHFSSTQVILQTLTFSSFHTLRQTLTLHFTSSVTQTFLQTVRGHSRYSGQWPQTLRGRVGRQASLQPLLPVSQQPLLP